MMTYSFLLALALPMGTMAQTTSVMPLLLITPLDADLDIAENGNTTFHGSVISVAPDATTYSVTRVPGIDCTECGGGSEVSSIYVNGPSTFARHLTMVDAITWDVDCNIIGTNADCQETVAGPSVEQDYYETGVFVWATSTLTPVTITAGLDKILAASTVTSGTAKTAASVSPGPSETGNSAPTTSNSNSTSTPSATASGTAIVAVGNIAFAAFCGVVAVALRL